MFFKAVAASMLRNHSRGMLPGFDARSNFIGAGGHVVLITVDDCHLMALIRHLSKQRDLNLELLALVNCA